MNEVPRLLILSDFTIENLRAYLENLDGQPRLQARVGPFGQVMPALLDPGHEVWTEPTDAVVVWTRPQAMSRSFSQALGNDNPSRSAFMDDVEQLADLVIGLKDRAATIFFPSWVLPPYLRGTGPMDFRGTGLSRLLLEANLAFARRFDDHPEIIMLNTQHWIEQSGPDAHDARYWYLGKIPFNGQVFQHAATEIRAALAGALGQARKLIVVDLDDTLWGGIIGDDGIDGIRLGGHDAVGEAFVDFQDALLALRRRGVLLAIVSKNEESVALDALRNHPEMRLRPDDFVGWRINWTDKAQNLIDLVAELNLGLQSVVFLDDNPAERARVAEELPEVLVPELPKDKLRYAQTLGALTCFDTPSINDEDRQRTEMYASERHRVAEQSRSASLDDWLQSLELVIGVEELNDANVKRIVQLLNKTNQMNLTSRRLTEPELLDWVAQGDRALWGLRVEDRFGDSGLTGIVSVDCGTEGDEARIVDFVLSCRVFGRQIERLMTKLAVDHARSRHRPTIAAEYRATAKNKPTLDYWDGSGFDRVDTIDSDGVESPGADGDSAGPNGSDGADNRLYRWDLSQRYEAPSFMTVR